jgi:hypothetical protein
MQKNTHCSSVSVVNTEKAMLEEWQNGDGDWRLEDKERKLASTRRCW